MTMPAVLRCALAALIGFAVVALVVSGLIAGSMTTGSEAQTTLVGVAAFLAPLAGAIAGAWQARAAGTTRPALGLVVAGLVALVLAMLVFGTNTTTSDRLNTLQPILAVVGAAAGALIYGQRWFSSTARL